MLKRVLMFGVLCGLILTLAWVSMAGSVPAAGSLSTANQLWQEHSYQMAVGPFRAVLAEADQSPAVTAEARFKLADSLWRAGGTAQEKEAADLLQEMIKDEPPERWRAEAQESLAEFYLGKDRWNHQQEIIDLLLAARDYWAGATDLELARPRFIRASFTLANFLSENWGWHYQGIRPTAISAGRFPVTDQQRYGLEVLYDEVLKVAQSAADKAAAHYGLAMSLINGRGGADRQDEAVRHLQTVIEEYRDSEWLDDAYYQLGQFYERRNEFNQALDIYQGLLARFLRGQSQWVDDAQRRIKDISDPQLAVSVGEIFVPGSEVRFGLRWRNTAPAGVALYKLDLAEQLRLDPARSPRDDEAGMGQYADLAEQIFKTRRYQSLPQALSFRVPLENQGKHLWYSRQQGLAEWQRSDPSAPLDPSVGVLAPGAYFLLVTAESEQAYDLILVSQTGLVIKTAGQSALFYTFDAESGAPLAGMRVKYHERYYDDRRDWVWVEGEGRTDEQGLLQVRLHAVPDSRRARQHQLFACAVDGDRQAFAQGNYYGGRRGGGEWRLYAFSDRPAYRPQEPVSFKGIVRRDNGTQFQNPSGMRVWARIKDPRGNVVKEGTYTLNAYGAFDDGLTLDETAPLGEYRLDILSADQKDHLAGGPLFRLEEYKLPEYLVTIQPRPRADAAAGTGYRLGDTVELDLDAQYYFGGAVAGAQVEYLIYQNNYYHRYTPPHEYDWYYPNREYHRGRGTLIKTETTVTDADGRAVLNFATPKDVEQDLIYTIEARVVDASRREITARGEVKVTRQGFYAYLTPRQALYRPGDRAEIDLRAMTANDEPVAVEGRVVVYRSRWVTPHPDPRVAESSSKPDSGYAREELWTKFIKTDAAGEAVVDFQPDQDGYYTVELTAYDPAGGEVKAAAAVYVCNRQSQDIGYRYGGLQIIPEQDTYQPGDTARLMLVAERPDTWVLLTSEAEEISDAQVLHLTGPVRLVERPVTGEDIPNIFISAVSADQYQLKSYNQELIVPPAQEFLNITIRSDQEVYGPQEEGTFEIMVTDQDDKPVVGEVALGVVDKSVFYIQKEYAGDIRKFFYGDKRSQSVRTTSSFQQQPYRHLVRGPDQTLMTAEELARWEREGRTSAADPKRDKGRDKGPAFQRGMSVPETMVDDFGEDTGVSGGLGFAMDETKALSSPAMAKTMEAEDQKDIGDAGPAAEAPAARTDFRSTVVWQPAVVTDAQGRAVVKARFSDALTTWTATARVINNATRVGNITYEVRTKKDLIVRLQAPRYFTERDRVMLSANVHNETDQPRAVQVRLQADGLTLEGAAEVPATVPAHGQTRVDWWCRVPAGSPGARITVSAAGGDLSDAMQKDYPVLPHGIEKFLAQAVVLRAEEAGTTQASLSLAVPAERIKETASLEINLSPSLAGSLLDALPYLADYPYGCVEQTMSRFLPSVIVAKTLRDLGLTEAQVRQYIRQVLEPRGDPAGHPDRREDATISRVEQMTREGLQRLYDFQHNDGGWGWWKQSKSDRFMTAYVVWGLALARQAGEDVRGDVLNRAVQYLQIQLVEAEDAPDDLAWMLHALAAAGSSSPYEDKQIARLWERRDQLNPYTRALFALAEHYRGHADRAQILARNLANGVQEDDENQTAHWGTSGVHYRWSEGGVEATAFCVKALSVIDSQSPYLRPAVKWLALNRRGARWKNTRDTAIAILGLADYLKASQELSPDYRYEVRVNGRVARAGQVNADNLLTFDRRIRVAAKDLADGENRVEVSLQGRGALYVSAYARFFTLEEDITPAGNEVFVERRYARLANTATLLKGYQEEWTPLAAGDSVESGDRVRVEITLEAKNHYEYLVAEDYRPAGFEAVELNSGAGTVERLDDTDGTAGQQISLYQEFRDQKAAFFIDRLPQGRYRISYELRAEVPGAFHGMPNQVHAMYVPEIRANSAEARLTIIDAVPPAAD